MSESLSPTQVLAGLLLKQSLADYVAEKRNAVPRWPWRLIATQLAADTDGQVDVTHETLRQWYGSAEVAA